MPQGSQGVKPYGEIYVATSRQHYEVISRAAEILGMTRSGFVRKFMLNPLGIIHSFVEYVNHLEARVRELEAALRDLTPIVKNVVQIDGVKYLVSVPNEFSHIFEEFVSVRGLDESFKKYVEDYLSGYNYIDDLFIKEINPRITVVKLDVKTAVNVAAASR